ncbi:MAG: glycosyltransferase family 4 protein [Candidatus Woesearchaeota archaeon]
MKSNKEIEPEIKQIFDENELFHEKNKLDRLRKVIGKFISQCKSPAGLNSILSRLQRIINIHPNTNKKYENLKKGGFKLLQLGIPYSINSGVVTVMRNITNAFQQSGANVAIINHWWHHYHYYDKKLDRNVRVKISPYCLLTGAGEFVALKWAFKHILKDLRDKGIYFPQICHVHTHTFYQDHAIQIFHSFFPKVPIVFTLHAFIPYLRMSQDQKLKLLADEMSKEEIQVLRKKGYHYREKSQEKMIMLADRVIAISQVHKDAFDRFYPEFSDKCVCIPNGTDFELFAKLEEVIEKERYLRSMIAPSGERIVIYVGRIEEQKGARRLAEGFNLIAEKYKDVKLVLVGANNSSENVLSSMGLKSKFLSRVHYAGWINDRATLAAYYRLADVMVQPVFSKNLYSMVALEAMMMKLPVISCPGELTVGHCKTPHDILKAVDKVFSDKRSVKRHLDNVKEHVIKNYSLSAVYRRHYKLYQSLLN